MDFRLDEEQLELQGAVRRFCAARFGAERLAQRAQARDEGEGGVASAWRELADLGAFSVLGAGGGSGDGAGVVAAAIVFEQLGAHLVDGPVLWTALAAPLVDGAATGVRVVGGLEQGAPDEGPILVEHPRALDALVVLRPDGVFLLERSALPAFVPVAPLDPLTPIARVGPLPRGERVAGVDACVRVRRVGTVLAAAMLLGIADAALDASRRWALAREQFGVAIGSFQAIQHLLADAYVRAALARGATYAAASVLDEPGTGDPAHAASAAKLLAGEAAVRNARTAVQVHGGMGFTWEMPPNFLLKRAWVLEQTFGDADVHADLLGGALAQEVRA